MYTNLNGKYANVGEVVIFSDGRFNYQQDNNGKFLSKEPGTAGMAFVAVRQKDKDTCEAFSDSRGIEQTVLTRSNLMAGRFALDAVLEKIKFGDWKSYNIRHVIFVTRSPYLFGPLVDGRIYIWQRYNWMVKKDGVLMERLNKDLWEDIVCILNDFKDIGIEVETMFLYNENHYVLYTLPENPAVLALEASNGNNLMKDSGFEKIYEGSDQKDSATPF